MQLLSVMVYSTIVPYLQKKNTEKWRIRMTFSKHGSILIGPGGRLPNILENRELLSRLQGAPELTSEELLRLAEFYKAYPTNALLGDHLALVALTKRERHRGAKGYRTLQKIVFSQHYETANIIEDSTEAVGNVLASDENVTDDEGHEDFGDFRLFIRHLPAEGLLVETLNGKDGDKEVNYNFVIGFSPAPSELWHE